MANTQLIGRRDQIVDNSGNPLSGGLVNIYEPNTPTRVTSYSDSALSVENANPVVLSGAGRASVWVSRNVDVRITDKDGNLIVEELSANPDDLAGDGSSGLVPNGSFESDVDANDVPDGWTNDVNDAGSNNGIDDTESTDGGSSWRTQSAGNGGGELITTDFFPVNDSDQLRVNFDLRSTVATVRNIVRVEWFDVSQVSISNTDVYDSTANPAVFTSQNLLATPPANARFAKIRIIGGTTGGIIAGITYWDNFNVFYPLVVAGVFDNLTLSGNDIISTNTNGDINITPNGTGRTVIGGLSATGAALASPVLTTPRIPADINTATPPVAEAVTAVQDFSDLAGDDTIGRVGFIGSNVLRVRNVMHGGGIELDAEDAGGVARVMVTADPDGAASLHQAGVLRIVTAASGVGAIRSDGDTDTEVRSLQLQHADGTERAVIGHTQSSDELRIYNRIHSGELSLWAEDSGGVEREGYRFDPDANSTLLSSDGGQRLDIRTGGIIALRSTGDTETENRYVLYEQQDATNIGLVGYTAAEGGNHMQVRNVIHGGHVELQAEDVGGTRHTMLVADPDGAVTLQHAGTDSFRTSDEDADDIAMGAQVRHADNSFYDVGMNVLPLSLENSALTFFKATIGKMVLHDDGSSDNYTINQGTNIPLGSMWCVLNESGTITLVTGSGVTLTYLQAAGTWTSTTGNVTFSAGIINLWKRSDTEYYAWGAGLP